MKVTKKLRAKLVKDWIKALRSGKFKQTRDGYLKECGEEKYCCLGVACVVLKNHFPKSVKIIGDEYSDVFEVGNSKSSMLLPAPAVAALGLRDDEASYTPENNLTDDNDGRRKSFKWIANKIEKEWKNRRSDGLFLENA